MGVRHELLDPAGVVLAGAAMGAAVATGLPARAIVAVGLAVFVTKTVTGLLLDRLARRSPTVVGLSLPDSPTPAVLASVAAGSHAAPEPAALRVFRREGEYWTIGYSLPVFRLKDSKGLKHLHRLLGDPGREFHVLDLATIGGVPPETPGQGRPLAADGFQLDSGAGAGAMLDLKAKDAYRRRLEDLRDDAEEARAWGDIERAARAEEEIAALAREIGRAVGLDGRDRTSVSAAERARVNVTRAVRAAIDHIAEHDRALGRHLTSTVKTGGFCVYAPDPDDTPSWQL